MNRLLWIALRNLSRNRRRTILSALAIGLGVAALLTFRGFINGQRFMMISNLTDGQVGALQIHRKGYLDNVQAQPLTLDFADTQELREKILAVEGVKALAPHLSFGAILSTPDAEVPEGRELREDEYGKTTYVIVTAVDPALEQQVLPRRFALLTQGQLLDASDAPGVAINEELMKSAGIALMTDPAARPDTVRWPALLTPDRDGALNGENIAVRGTFMALLPGENRTLLMPLETAQRLVRMDGRITEYALAVDRLEDVGVVRDRIAATLGEAYEVHTYKQLMPVIDNVVSLADTIFGLIGVIFLVVVLLGILNSMLMNVLERVREIGTMMAVGTRRWKILVLMVLEGAGLGLMGGLLGVALGAGVTVTLGYIGVPITIPGAEFKHLLRPFLTLDAILQTAAMAVVGASLAALWPAWRASRLDPVAALRAP